MTNYDPVETGMRIRKSRKNLGLKQFILANKIGITSGTLSKYENGIGRMTFEMACKIASALEVEVEWLLHGESVDIYNGLLDGKLFISRWRKVDEEKPENGKDVLAGYWYGESWIVLMTEYYDGFNCSKDNRKHEITKVTHWMPLPMPPKKEGDYVERMG